MSLVAHFAGKRCTLEELCTCRIQIAHHTRDTTQPKQGEGRRPVVLQRRPQSNCFVDIFFCLEEIAGARKCQLGPSREHGGKLLCQAVFTRNHFRFREGLIGSRKISQKDTGQSQQTQKASHCRRFRR